MALYKYELCRTYNNAGCQTSFPQEHKLHGIEIIATWPSVLYPHVT